MVAFNNGQEAGWAEVEQWVQTLKQNIKRLPADEKCSAASYIVFHVAAEAGSNLWEMLGILDRAKHELNKCNDNCIDASQQEQEDEGC